MLRLPRLLVLTALVVGCGGGSLKQAGEQCVSSSECDVGLVCDLGVTPHVCASTISVDARELDAADVDADPTDAAAIDGPRPIDAPTPIDGPTAVDAPAVDAPAVDAPPMIDAMPIDAMPVDAAVPIDAPPDA